MKRHQEPDQQGSISLGSTAAITTDALDPDASAPRDRLPIADAPFPEEGCAETVVANAAEWSAVKPRRRGLLSRREPEIPAAALDAASALQAKHGSAMWSEPVALGKQPALACTLGDGLALVTWTESRTTTTLILGTDIRWIKSRGGGVELGVEGHEDLAPEGALVLSSKTDRLFTELMKIPRRPGSVRPPARQAAVLPPSRPGRADRRPPARSARRREVRRGGPTALAGRVVTPFAPTAYVEHPDGVLRPCAWTGEDPAPQVGATVTLTMGDAGWSSGGATEERV